MSRQLEDQALALSPPSYPMWSRSTPGHVQPSGGSSPRTGPARRGRAAKTDPVMTTSPGDELGTEARAGRRSRGRRRRSRRWPRRVVGAGDLLAVLEQPPVTPSPSCLRRVDRPEDHVAVVDVAAEDHLRVGGDRRACRRARSRCPPPRSRRSSPMSAANSSSRCGFVQVEMSTVAPSGSMPERSRKPGERTVGAEALEGRRRAETDLPAQRLLPRGEALLAQRQHRAGP